MTQLFGVQIDNPNPDKIEIVRTADEPRDNHHPILDDPQYTDMMPWVVTVKTHDKAVRAVGVVYDVVDQDGINHSFGWVFTMPAYRNVINRHGSMEFYPGGRMPRFIAGNPLMTVDELHMDMIKHAQSVVFHLDYVEFEDGSIMGPNVRGTQHSIENARILRERRRGLK